MEISKTVTKLCATILFLVVVHVEISAGPIEKNIQGNLKNNHAVTLVLSNSGNDNRLRKTIICEDLSKSHACLTANHGKTLALSNGATIKLSGLNSGCVLYPNDPICGFNYINQDLPVTVRYGLNEEYSQEVKIKVTLSNRYCVMKPQNYLCKKSLNDKIRSLGISGEMSAQAIADLLKFYSYSPANTCHNGITAKNVRCKSKF